MGRRLHDKSWVNLILFADNYWLIATNHTMLESMTTAWLDLLGEYGWETPTEELTCVRRRRTEKWRESRSPSKEP